MFFDIGVPVYRSNNENKKRNSPKLGTIIEYEGCASLQLDLNEGMILFTSLCVYVVDSTIQLLFVNGYGFLLPIGIHLPNFCSFFPRKQFRKWNNCLASPISLETIENNNMYEPKKKHFAKMQ